MGVAVNAVVLPPVHSLHAGKLAAALPRDCARLLREMGDGLEEYDAQRAESWNRSANDLLTALSELYVGRRWDSESFRLNPVRRLRRSTPAPSADWDIVWARVANRLLGLTLTLWETASENRELPRPPDRALDELGRLLSAAADACTAYGTIMAHGDDEEARPPGHRPGRCPPGPRLPEGPVGRPGTRRGRGDRQPRGRLPGPARRPHAGGVRHAVGGRPGPLPPRIRPRT